MSWDHLETLLRFLEIRKELDYDREDYHPIISPHCAEYTNRSDDLKQIHRKIARKHSWPGNSR